MELTQRGRHVDVIKGLERGMRVSAHLAGVL